MRVFRFSHSQRTYKFIVAETFVKYTITLWLLSFIFQSVLNSQKVSTTLRESCPETKSNWLTSIPVDEPRFHGWFWRRPTLISRMLEWLAKNGKSWSHVSIFLNFLEPFLQWVLLATPTGQLPLLEYNGMKLCQSNAMARFLAKEFNMAGQNRTEEAKVDMIVYCFEDLFTGNI